MGRGGLRRILLAGLAAGLVLSPLLPSAAAGSRLRTPHAQSGQTTEQALLHRGLRIAQEQGAPRELIEALDAIGVTTRYAFSVPWPDLSGNGLADVLVIDLEFVEAEVFSAGSLRMTAREGLTGRELWRRTERFDDGFAIPLNGRVGKGGRNGVIVFEIEDFTFGFKGISHKGKRIYHHSVGLLTEDEMPLLFRRELVNIGFLNAIKGKATDILFGEARITNLALPAEGTVNQTEVTFLDGRDGRLVVHEDKELSLGNPPVPYPGPDIDSDGLDDYVVVGVLPDLEMDEQTGLPVTPNLEADYLRGRRGRDGAKLWTSDPVNLSTRETFTLGPLVLYSSDYVRAEDAGDLTADGVADVLLDPAGFGTSDRLRDHAIHVLDGATGILAWSANGEIPIPVPDIDRDGKRDVLTATGLHSGDEASVKLIAYSGRTGERLYKRSYRLKGVSEEGSTFLGLFQMGDVEPDGLPEFYIYYQWSDGHGSSSARRFVVNLRNGKRHRLRLRENEWIVGPVDGRGDDVIRYLGPGVVVFDGRSDRPLLRVTMSPPGSVPLSEFFLSVGATGIDHDRCADLVGTFDDGTNYYSVVIDGGSGTLRWSSRELGVVPREGLKVASREDLNRSC